MKPKLVVSRNGSLGRVLHRTLATLRRSVLLFLVWVVSTPYNSATAFNIHKSRRNLFCSWSQPDDERETTRFSTQVERLDAKWEFMFQRLKKYREHHGDCLVPQRYKADQWETMFEKLKAYKQQHGDWVVPQEYPIDPQLGAWVSSQRTQKYKLDASRVDCLEEIGFVWDPLRQQWEAMFEKLKAYKQQHGDLEQPEEDNRNN